MLMIVWEYHVSRGKLEDFESFYRPDGPWGEFFRGAPGFVSVTLMKDVRTPGRYMVSDRWTNALLYEEFKHQHAAAYRELSQRARRLYDEESEVGRFEFLE